MRIHWLPSPVSASRIVVPVCDMKTSSSDGRDTLTDRMPTPSSANSRGTNASPAGAWHERLTGGYGEHHLPLGEPRLDVELVLEGPDRRVVVDGRDLYPVLPDRG